MLYIYWLFKPPNFGPNVLFYSSLFWPPFSVTIATVRRVAEEKESMKVRSSKIKKSVLSLVDKLTKDNRHKTVGTRTQRHGDPITRPKKDNAW